MPDFTTPRAIAKSEFVEQNNRLRSKETPHMKEKEESLSYYALRKGSTERISMNGDGLSEKRIPF